MHANWRSCVERCGANVHVDMFVQGGQRHGNNSAFKVSQMCHCAGSWLPNWVGWVGSELIEFWYGICGLPSHQLACRYVELKQLCGQ